MRDSKSEGKDQKLWIKRLGSSTRGFTTLELGNHECFTSLCLIIKCGAALPYSGFQRK